MPDDNISLIIKVIGLYISVFIVFKTLTEISSILQLNLDCSISVIVQFLRQLV